MTSENATYPDSPSLFIAMMQFETHYTQIWVAENVFRWKPRYLSDLLLMDFYLSMIVSRSCPKSPQFEEDIYLAISLQHKTQNNSMCPKPFKVVAFVPDNVQKPKDRECSSRDPVPLTRIPSPRLRGCSKTSMEVKYEHYNFSNSQSWFAWFPTLLISQEC